MEYMDKRMETILLTHEYSFRGIIEMLRCDSMDKADTSTFLDGMEKFIQEYFVFLPEFASKRKETIANLFKGEQDRDS